MHDVQLWANNLIWYTEAADSELVHYYLDRVIAITRKGQSPVEYVDFPNSLREPESPVARR